MVASRSEPYHVCTSASYLCTSPTYPSIIELCISIIVSCAPFTIGFWRRVFRNTSFASIVPTWHHRPLEAGIRYRQQRVVSSTASLNFHLDTYLSMRTDREHGPSSFVEETLRQAHKSIPHLQFHTTQYNKALYLFN